MGGFGATLVLPRMPCDAGSENDLMRVPSRVRTPLVLRNRHALENPSANPLRPGPEAPPPHPVRHVRKLCPTRPIRQEL